MSDFQKYLKYKNKYKQLLAGSDLSTKANESESVNITVILTYALTSNGEFDKKYTIPNNISLKTLLNSYTQDTGIYPLEVYKKGDENL